jgi:thiol-disulfide isomerase/thioredoxin
MNFFKTALLTGILLSELSAVNAQYNTVLKGTVAGRSSKAIYLLPRTKSVRSENKIEIPIVNNKFQYTLNATELEAYELIFKDELDAGAWRHIAFFPDTAIVEFRLYEMAKADDNEIKGGNVNREYYRMEKERKALFTPAFNRLVAQEQALIKKDQFYSPAYMELNAQLRKLSAIEDRQLIYEKRHQLEKKGEHLTAQGMKMRRSLDSLNREIANWKYLQIDQVPNLAKYYMIVEDMQYRAKEDSTVLRLIQDSYIKYTRAFPDHKYTKLVTDGLRGLLQIYPGKPFVDFTAPDLDGKEYRLSSLIEGKTALIDLWGSWCGPCIVKSRQVVPLYEKYQSKGFTVVGVAREFDNTDELLKRLNKEKFSWLNLLELDDKNGIWNKYTVPNGGGLTVLVDKAGKIVAVDPTAEEIEQYLSKLP